MDFLHGFTLDFILCGDVMKKYWDIYNQILTAKSFPVDIRTGRNPQRVAFPIRHFLIKNNLPLTLKVRGERLIINKKADAVTPAEFNNNP